MIEEENKKELELISAVIIKNADSNVISDIIYEAINEAIYTSTDIDDAIRYIIINHPPLLKNLARIVKDNYPDKFCIVEKLGILI